MRQGFTLIEVTVALAIFAIAAVVLSQSFLAGMLSLSSFKYDDTNVEMQQWINREFFAQDKLEDLQNGGFATLLDGSTAKWNTIIEEAEPLGLYDVTVDMQIIGEEELTDIFTYKIYRPKWVNLSAEKQ